MKPKGSPDVAAAKKPMEVDTPTVPSTAPAGPTEPATQLKTKALSLVSYSSEEDSDSDAE